MILRYYCHIKDRKKKRFYNIYMQTTVNENYLIVKIRKIVKN